MVPRRRDYPRSAFASMASRMLNGFGYGEETNTTAGVRKWATPRLRLRPFEENRVGPLSLGHARAIRYTRASTQANADSTHPRVWLADVVQMAHGKNV
jgi:hypothetical protein